MKNELITFSDPKSPLSEVFRTLRTNIQFTNMNKKSNVILVTSASPGEGKSWTSSNLAVTFAQADNRVLLIDGDMRKGRVYRTFEVSPKPGLSDFLAEEGEHAGFKEMEKYIQRTQVENLYIISAGTIPPNPSELLVKRQMNTLLEKSKEAFDIIIIDGTPCNLVTDSVILSRIADSTIIVAAHGETKKEDLNNTVKAISNVGAHLAGIVLNKMPKTKKKYNQSYYYGSTLVTKKSKRNNDRSRVSRSEFYNVNLSELKKEKDNVKEKPTFSYENNTQDAGDILNQVKSYLQDNLNDN